MNWIRYNRYIVDLDIVGSITTYGDTKIELRNKNGEYIETIQTHSIEERDRTLEEIVKRLPGQVKDL